MIISLTLENPLSHKRFGAFFMCAIETDSQLRGRFSTPANLASASRYPSGF